MKVKFKKLHSDVVAPEVGTAKSAGFDIHAYLKEPIVIEPHTTVKIPTGLAITPPEGYFAGIFARSGLATKKGLRPANCVAVCDEDYRGEYFIPLHNDSTVAQTVEPNDRIVQMIFLPYVSAEFEEADALDETERGDGGFGSTGR